MGKNDVWLTHTTKKAGAWRRFMRSLISQIFVVHFLWWMHARFQNSFIIYALNNYQSDK